MPDKKPHAGVQRKVTTGSHYSPDSEEALHHNSGAPITSTAELRRAVSDPRSASPAVIMGLQSRYGNQAVQRLIAKSSSGEVQRGFLGNLKNKMFGRKVPKGTDEEAVHYFITDPEASRFFKKYCEMEFSTENFNSYLLITDFIKKGLPQSLAIAFQRRFIGRQAPEELNLPSNVVQNFQAKMKKGEMEPDLFDKVKESIMINLLDTYSRFKVSSTMGDWTSGAENPTT